MIRTYEQWIKEKNDKFQPVGIKTSYKAGVEEARHHYDRVLRKTSNVTLEVAEKIAEMADAWPEQGAKWPLNWNNLCREMSEALKKTKETK